MADKKITQLNNITGANLVDADEFVVVDISADETKAITLGELKEAFDAGSGFVRVTGDTMTGALNVQSTITTSGSVNVGNDLNITGPSPIIKLTDNDTADEYTLIQNLGGATFIDGRNGTGNGAIIFRGQGGGTNDEYARFIANGNFGIGENVPAAPLHVNGGTTNTVARFHSDDSGASLYLTDSGTTGGDGAFHGLITTGNDLEVRGLGKVVLATGTTDRLIVDANGDVTITDGDLTINGGTGDDSFPLLNLSSNETNISSGEVIGKLQFESNDTSGGAGAGVKGSIRIDATAGYTSTFGGARMEFFTSTPAGTNTRAGYFDDDQKLVLNEGLRLDSNQNPDAQATASISGTTMTVTAVTAGTIAVGMYVIRSGITPNTQVLALGTGTGGTGTYTVSISQTVSSAAFYLKSEFSNRISFKDADTSAVNSQVFGTIDWVSADGAGTKGFLLVQATDSSPDSEMIFGTNNLGNDGNHATEKMRLTHDGYLLVGKTTSGIANTGVEAQQDGHLVATREGTSTQPTVRLNKLTNDGSILQFDKNGVSVGAIGVASSNNLYIGATTASHAGVYFGTNIVYPMTAGSISNGAVDLGEPTAGRFKNLHLSGGVVFGVPSGDITSNTLDDYEEGTWTPVYSDATSGGSNGTPNGGARGRYTKVGNLVTVTASCANLDTSGMTGSSDLYILGAPFAAIALAGAPTTFWIGATRMGSVEYDGYVTAMISDGVSYIRFSETRNDASVDQLIISLLQSGAADLYFTLTYETSS